LDAIEVRGTGIMGFTTYNVHNIYDHYSQNSNSYGSLNIIILVMRTLGGHCFQDYVNIRSGHKKKWREGKEAPIILT
jgi:hypothetical protein